MLNYIKITMKATAQSEVLDTTAQVSTIYKDFDQHSEEQTFSKIRIHTPSSNDLKINLQNAVAPFYETYESMIEDDAHASDTRTYPVYTGCPYLGLRRPFMTSTEKSGQRTVNTTCRQRPQSPEGCKEAVKYYGESGGLKAKICSSSQKVELCSILKRTTKRQGKYFEVLCNRSQCDEKSIMVALFNETTGMISENDWRLVPNTKFLGKLFHRHVLSSKFGSGFALLKCEGKDALHVLILPNKISKHWKKRLNYGRGKQERLNINIVIEDSFSRAHFYRTLSKTASAFRDIVNDQSIPATVIDFEMFQSYASATYKNIQRLFTGRKYVGSKGELTYGIEEFFARFKKEGYTTLFQEDLCWYDDWGSMLDPRQKVGKVQNTKTRTERWRTFVEILRKTRRSDVIDDFGMTFLTCSAYAHLNVTNIYDARKTPNVCFKGQHYSTLFLEYVKKYVDRNDESGQPFISYTHLDTSHERTGKRIVNDDAALADLFLNAAYLSNTITIFASDHGGKSTAFSTYTTQGRQEVFQPLLFIILPHQVGKKLGVNVMNSLVVNQKRLVGFEDLHYALLSLRHLWRVRARTRASGLFNILPLNRTCEDLILKPDVLCLCDGMDESVANNSQTVLWAAEYALGSLNNRIQNQYVASLKWKLTGHITSDNNGYGACQRYTGIGISRARRMITEGNQTLQFSLLVQPFHLKKIEVFDVQVTFPVHKENGIVLNELLRVSTFNVYEECADDGVDLKLCACHSTDGGISKWQNKLILKGRTKKSFSLKPKSYILDYPCLAIVFRSRQMFIQSKYWQDRVITYEALNACALVTYNLTVGIKKARKTRLSLTRPFTVTLFPRTMTFLMTVNNDWKFGNVSPKFEFKKHTL